MALGACFIIIIIIIIIFIIITNVHCLCNRILDSFPDLATEDPNRADVLGAPIGHISEVTNTLQKKTKLLELMGERLHDLPAHEGLFLLKYSLSPRYYFCSEPLLVSCPHNSRFMITS